MIVHNALPLLEAHNQNKEDGYQKEEQVGGNPIVVPLPCGHLRPAWTKTHPGGRLRPEGISGTLVGIYDLRIVSHRP